MARPTARYAITAEDKTKAAIGSVKRNLSDLRAPFAAIAGLATGAFAVFSKSAIQAADDLNKLRDRLGFSVEALSQYQFVAQQTGVSFNTLTTGLQRLQRRVSEAAQGFGEAKNALFELGVDATRLTQLRPEQQFEVLADAFERVEDQASKTRLAMKLFDTEGVALLQTMKGGSAAVRALREEFARMGGTLSQDVADTATETVDAVGRLRAQFRASGVELVRIFGPAITAVANWLSETLPKAVRRTGQALVLLRSSFTKLAAVVADLFGQDELAENLNDLSRVYFEEFQKIGKEIDNFKVELGDAVRAQDFFDESLKRNLETKKKSTAAQKALNAELAKAKQLTESVRTPFESYQASLDQYRRLLDAARITQETFNRLTAAARETFLAGLGIDPTPLQEYQRGLQAINEELDRGSISFEEYARRRFELEEQLEGTTENTKQKIKETTDAMTEFSKQAARSAQSAMSDFFFDPFNSSLSDLLSNFANTMRRLAAEAAAAAIFESLPGSSGGLLGILGSVFGRAGGGPVGVRSPAIVGERGPELLLGAPPGSQIVPAQQAGASVVVNVTAGASVNRESAMQVGYDIGRQINDSIRRNG